MKNASGVSEDSKENASNIVERLYRGAEALGVVVGIDDTPDIDRMNLEGVCP